MVFMVVADCVARARAVIGIINANRRVYSNVYSLSLSPFLGSIVTQRVYACMQILEFKCNLV